MPKECIVLAGGLGTRLQSAVADKPKCLADIDGKPFLFYICNQLNNAQFTDVIFSVGYLKEMVQEWVLANQHLFNFKVHFAVEDKPLGTGGGIKNALQYCHAQNVCIVNGDTYFAIDFKELLASHVAQNANITLALKPMQHFDRYGTVVLNNDNRITAFTEKQPTEKGLINGGIYCINQTDFMQIHFPAIFSFEQLYLEKYVTQHTMQGIICDNYFIDIGIPTDYAKAQIELPLLKNKI